MSVDVISAARFHNAVQEGLRTPKLTPSPSHGRPLDFSADLTDNQTVRDVVAYFSHMNFDISVVEHTRDTSTCAEKLNLIAECPEYLTYGHIRIAKGSLLTWKAEGQNKFMLHMTDSESKIDFKALKSFLGLGKKQDLHFYKGDVEEIIGLEHGGVSVLVNRNTHLDLIYFDSPLVAAEYEHSGVKWDFAFSRRHSILIQPWALIECLRDYEPFKGKLHSYMPSPLQFK